MPITIVLAEPQDLVRSGIRCLLEEQADFKIKGEVADGREAVRLVQRLKPRVLIVALAMPGLNCLEITSQVQQHSPTTAVIVLSTYSNDHYVVQALKTGASGYVMMYVSPAELMHAIRKVVAGHCYLSRPMSGRSMETWMQRARSAARDAYETLTRREREVLRLVFDGYTSARIASHLSISRRTAESHRAKVMHKLDFRNQTDLIKYVLTRAILTPIT
jgi:two-component system, NarL family, response regulator NreC